MANDKATGLQRFLQRKPLNHAVIPESREYSEQQLHVQAYLTHLVVGRDGKIAHVAGSASYLASTIDAALQPEKVLAVH